MEDDLTSASLGGTSSDDDQSSLTDILTSGAQYHNAGQLAEAEIAYKQVLQRAPTHPVALHLLGVIAHQVGQNKIAVDLITQALAVKPDYADAHSHLGSAMKALGHFNEAVASFKKAIDLNPDFAMAYFNLGNAYNDLGRLEDAAEAYQQAIRVSPENADAYTNLGNVYKAMGRLDEAVTAYRKVLSIRSGFAEGHYNLGSVLARRGELEAAVVSYQQAIALRPDYAEAYSNLGSLFRDMWRMGSLLIDTCRMDEAISCFRKAIEIDPEFAAAHSNLGTVLKDVWRLEEAVASYQTALAIDPEYAEAMSNLGNALKELDDLTGAIECYRKSIALDPNSMDPHRNLGLALLLSGDFENGWASYARRWETKDHPTPPPFFDKTLWRGEPLIEQVGSESTVPKKILFWMEMGIGDEIMFASMIPDLVATGAEVVVECAPRLTTLFERSFPGVPFVARGTSFSDRWDGEGLDYQIPAGDIGQYLRQSIDRFSNNQPFIIPDHNKQDSVRAEYTKRWPGKRLVGISWRSGDKTAGVKRSIALDQWLPILAAPGCQFINLQYGDVAGELVEFADQTGHEIYFDANVDPILDMDTFTAQVAALDLVISIDNSTVHVAGAVGVPTWVMLPKVPEWRWLTEGNESLWYSSVHLYRQPKRDDWQSVIEQVGQDLRINHG